MTKRLLTGSFIILFAASLVLILLEGKDKREGETALRPRATRPAVQGESTAIDNSTARYRQEIINLLLKVKNGEVQEAGAGLLAVTVPAAYQDLHWRLVKLFSVLASPNPDTDFVGEQKRLLGEDFPWLAKTL